MKRKGASILTHSGMIFWPLEPKPEEILIDDIAHGLSNICRYTGQCKRFYSVAQHSVISSQQFTDTSLALYALLHDASEAYICDISSPIKNTPEMAPYRKMEDNLMKHICRKFNLPEEMPEEVHIIDKRMLVTEMEQLMHGKPKSIPFDALPITITPVYPKAAKEMFLNRFKELTR